MTTGNRFRAVLFEVQETYLDSLYADLQEQVRFENAQSEGKEPGRFLGFNDGSCLMWLDLGATKYYWSSTDPSRCRELRPGLRMLQITRYWVDPDSETSATLLSVLHGDFSGPEPIQSVLPFGINE